MLTLLLDETQVLTFIPFILGFIALSMGAGVFYLILQPRWLTGRIIGTVLALLLGFVARNLTGDARPAWPLWVLFIPGMIGVCTALFYPRKD